MGQNPINLTVRFILEIVALVSIGAWAKYRFPGALGSALMIIFPLIAAVIWGTFNVAGSFCHLMVCLDHHRVASKE